jgi:hypothetical protein
VDVVSTGKIVAEGMNEDQRPKLIEEKKAKLVVTSISEETRGKSKRGSERAERRRDPGARGSSSARTALQADSVFCFRRQES